MKINETVQNRIEELAEKSQKVDLVSLAEGDEETIALCENVRVYLIDDRIKEELLLVKEGVNAMSGDSREFRKYAKLLNPKLPAFKYKLVLRKRSKEIFDPDKVRERLRGEIARWGNRERKALREQIDSFDPPISHEEQGYMVERLEKRIEAEIERVELILADYDSYKVVITNHATAGNYPALYLTLRSDDAKGYIKHGTEHLRTGVPNFLWYSPASKPIDHRADMKIDTIVQTYECVGDSIYIKRVEES